MTIIPRGLRVPLRGLLHTPWFTTLAILTLGIGIGANVAIFSVVYGVLLRPLSLPEPDRIVAVWHTFPGIDSKKVRLSDAAYRFYQERNRSLEAMGIYINDEVNLTGGPEPERVVICGVTAPVFTVLRVPPALGRALVKEDERPGAEPVTVISYALWQRLFGGSPTAIGKILRVDGTARRVVGVMPERFAFPRVETSLWLPITIDPGNLIPGNYSYTGIGRLRPGVTEESAARELSALAQQLPEAVGEPFTRASLDTWKLRVLVRDLLEDRVGDVARTLWILLGSAGLILLIACANVANLLLVRAEGRRREMAVRVALGASRGEVARLFLTESMLLALVGGLVGLGLAGAGIRLLLRLRPPGIPRLDEVSLNSAVLVFTLLVVLLAGSLAGAIAVLRSIRPELVPSLKEGGKGGTGSRASHRARQTLATVQVSLALVLLVGAALLIKSFWQLQAVNPGLQPRGVLTLSLTLPRTEYPDAQAIARFVRNLEEKVQAVPGVRAAGMISQLPLGGGSSNSSYKIEDQPSLAEGVLPSLNNQFVSPSYFETLGIPILEGTTLPRIDPAQRQDEVVISQSVAERFWPGKSALGKRLTPEEPREGEWYTVVGVVGDVREAGLQDEPTQVVYYGWRRLANLEGKDHWVPPGGVLVVRTDGDPASLAKPVRDAIHAVDPNLPVAYVRTMEEVMERSTARAAFTMLLLGIAATIALLLGGIGVYAVVAYIVSQRTREIGVRMAMGAGRADITRLVLQDGLLLAFAGVGIGLLAAFLLARFLGALLYNVSPSDPTIFAGVPLFLALVILFASWFPARRAAAVEPSEAIRSE